MAAKVKIKPKEKNEKKEADDWSRFLFKEELNKAGMTEIMGDDLESLVHSEHSWEDAERLREKDCPPDLIIKILSKL